MMSAIFWLSFAAVFLGIRWLADGLLAAASVEVQRKRPRRPELSRSSSDSGTSELPKAA